MSVHQDDRNRQRDEEPWLLVRNERKKPESADKGEHGHGVHVDDARFVAPVVSQHLREVADGRKHGGNS